MRRHAETFLQSRCADRRGAITVLTAFVLVAMLAVAGLLLSLSQLELARAELQLATDATVRSAVISMVVTQSESVARAAARDIASRHRVAGSQFMISDSDVVFGTSELQPSGAWTFSHDGSVINAAQIHGMKTASSAAGSVDLPFGGFIGFDHADTTTSAVATQLDYDIVLVLDRSGSMGWDMSQFKFSYPVAVAHRPLLENYFSPPDATGSRWAILSQAVTQFLTELSSREVPARVGLVTFASDYEFGLYVSERVTVNADLTSSHSVISTSIKSIGKIPVIGGTDIGAGLSKARELLMTSPAARPKTAFPIIVLFSDGIFTEGDDPLAIARSLYNDNGIVVHSVTFGADADARITMDEVANLAGKGLSIHADNQVELVNGFREIANSIPVILTE